MVATVRNEITNQRETVRLLCIEWQACHLAGMPAYEVTLAKQRYLQAVKVLRMMEAR